MHASGTPSSPADVRQQRQALEAVLNPRPGYPASEAVIFAAFVAHRHQIALVRAEEFSAVDGHRRVNCRPLTSDADVASVHHEYGHVVDPVSRRWFRYDTEAGRPRLFNFEGELFAWEWALQSIGRRWTKDMHKCLVECLCGYRSAFTAYITPPQRTLMERLEAYSARKAGGVVFLQPVRILMDSAR